MNLVARPNPLVVTSFAEVGAVFEEQAIGWRFVPFRFASIGADGKGGILRDESAARRLRRI